MGLSSRLKIRMRRFLQRPGHTVDLTPLEKHLPKIDALEDELEDLTDEQLTERAGEAVGYVDICAIGREAARRALDQRPYDVQLIGAMAMLDGRVAEMATGEGKTLAATIAAYGHVRAGHGPVHVITVNDYLARRDAQWMEPVYTLLGLTVGWVNESSSHDERKAAYDSDVTYVSVSEGGFDFLRDQLVTDIDERVQRPLATAIVDEADSILIDEARVPMVLAGGVAQARNTRHAAAAKLVQMLRPGRDYEIADDNRSVALTDTGLARIEKKLGGVDLYDGANAEQLSLINVSLHANVLLKRDVDYIVRGDKVELVDEMRGRVAQRRRWPDGLQAAVEAKEGITATAEGEILNTITVQAYVALYKVVCGMTATAVIVGDQLREFFKLEVAMIPPNTPCIREDEADRIYAAQAERDEALVAEIKACNDVGRPVLVGTLDVKQSEELADLLRAQGITASVLNAKNDDEEAAIIAEAGALHAVTVSTQMAGRGVDIRLGGSKQVDYDAVAELGGLLVLGAGRHDSRRVDNQLRGRSGRQGDPGGSVFFVCLEDDLIVRHAPEAIPPMPKMSMEGLVEDDQVDFAVEHAQRVAEGVAHEIHRNTWRYSVVIEEQRQQIADLRERLLSTEDAADLLMDQCVKADDIDRDVLVQAGRSIALYHLDRSWTDHLAELADVREGVHLRALGRLDPLDEFHRAAVPLFNDLIPAVEQKTIETFEEAEIDDAGWHPEESEMVRPSATWTYLVHENPFGSELDRLIAAVGRRLSSSR